eukprot:m.92117 g.92117  ORF g.92117 m.92117 type:complete len:455 (-) comp15061_c0_seq5:103-1467(-)
MCPCFGALSCRAGFLALCALLAGSGTTASVANQWRTVVGRYTTNSEVVPEDGAVPFAATVPPGVAPTIDGRSFAPITTGPCNGGLLQTLTNPANVSTAFHFELRDQRAGAKTRVELTSCFATNATLRRHGVDPDAASAIMYKTLSFVDENCSGAPSVPASNAQYTRVIHQITYDLTVTGLFNPEAQVIAGQFHGRPDPRLFRAPNNTVTRLTLEQAYRVCTSGDLPGSSTVGMITAPTEARRSSFCNEGSVIDKSGQATNWTYEQGGYPPLVFGYAHATNRFAAATANISSASSSAASALSSDASAPLGYWYVLARSDARVMSPKADCGFNAAKDSDWPTRSCPDPLREQVHGLWRQRYDALPQNQPLPLKWLVEWSRYNTTDLSGGELYRNGTVQLWVAGQKVVDWVGPVGRADEGRLPYFKIGMYNPSGDVSPLGLNYENFWQNWTVVTAGE